MSLHDMLCVALYEAKQQSRRVEFHLFVFFSLVGIMACHVYWLVAVSYTHLDVYKRQELLG